jgi:hypothetical protein
MIICWRKTGKILHVSLRHGLLQRKHSLIERPAMALPFFQIY